MMQRLFFHWCFLFVLMPAFAKAESVSATIKYVGVSPVSNTVIVYPNVATIPGTTCKLDNQIKWSIEEKTSSAILSLLLSAYHAGQKVRIEYEPADGCVGSAQKGRFVRYTE